MPFNPLTRFVLVCLITTAIFMIQTNKYPVARKSDQVDDYHGVKVADPYRWLEDLDSAETRQWVEAENNLTFAFLNAIPQRAAIRERLTKLWNYEKYGVPFKEGNRYFYTRNSGLQNQSVLYTVTSLDAQPQMILDPNTLSPDGTVAATRAVAVTSGDSRVIANIVLGSGGQTAPAHHHREGGPAEFLHVAAPPLDDHTLEPAVTDLTLRPRRG